MPSVKWRPFCLGLSVLSDLTFCIPHLPARSNQEIFLPVLHTYRPVPIKWPCFLYTTLTIRGQPGDLASFFTGPTRRPCILYHIHPCEKVIEIFFRHEFFTVYFLLFVLVFIHDICEVVSINSVDFCWISITGYTSVTFWNRHQGKNRMSH